MISRVLLKREIKANYKMLLLFMAILSMYSVMIIAMYDPQLGDSLTAMAQSMPELFAAFGMLDVGATLIDFLTNYLYGFLFIVFPLVFAILLANHLMARYVDRGSMAYLLSTPNSRAKIVRTQMFCMILNLFLLVLFVTGLCIMVSELMFSGQLPIKSFLMVNVGLYGLLLFFGSLCFCSSCIFTEIKLAVGVGAGLSIVFVMIQMLSQVSDKFSVLAYITPLALFDIQEIILGNINAILAFCILYAAAIVLFIIGGLVFCKKDLSI